MNCRVQLALLIMAAIALPALTRAGDTEAIAKRRRVVHVPKTR